MILFSYSYARFVQRLALAATGGTGYCPKAEKVQSQKNA
jgi:hypothetical protein